MLTPQLSNDFWSNVIITAAGDNETFDDVKVVTLRSYWSDMVYDMAYHAGANHPTRQAALNIINTEPAPWLYEHVVIAPDGITVVLDIDTIDDDAIFKSMWALSQAVDQLDGCYGTVNVGNGRQMLETDLIRF